MLQSKRLIYYKLLFLSASPTLRKFAPIRRSRYKP